MILNKPPWHYTKLEIEKLCYCPDGVQTPYYKVSQVINNFESDCSRIKINISASTLKITKRLMGRTLVGKETICIFGWCVCFTWWVIIQSFIGPPFHLGQLPTPTNKSSNRNSHHIIAKTLGKILPFHSSFSCISTLSLTISFFRF